MRRQQKRRFNGRSDPVRVDDHEICGSGEVAAFVSPGMEESMTLKRPLYPIFEAPEDTADEEGIEDTQHVEKKRRLSVEQVKSLEKHFEKENKLEPERKLQLARELGLQPRQVAVWFQNRRARWKTKQLEKDYDALKANLDALKGDYSSLLQEKEKLESEVNRLNELLSSRSGEGKPGKPELKVKVEKEDGTMLGMKKDSASSDSDDSEIVDGESPHPIDSQSGFSYHQDLEMDALECQITGDTYEHLVYPKLSKFEESDSSSFLDLEEDQDGSLSWWDWS